MQVNTLGIVGAGTMGTGIAQVAAQAGIRVILMDTGSEAIVRSQKALAKSLQVAVEKVKLTADQAESVRELIAWDIGLDRLGEADWVIEAVFEDFAAKEVTLQDIAARIGPHVPVASNTSTFPIHRLAQAFGHPHRFLGMHFFNPAPAMKLVEIIPGEHTLPSVVEAALELCDRMDKVPKLAPDIPGFIVNRAFGALVSAACEMLTYGAEAEDIDTAIELGLGHRMGPLRTADLVGLDVMLALLQSLSDQTTHPRFEVPPVLRELVEAGKLGKKSKEGFYAYGDLG